MEWAEQALCCRAVALEPWCVLSRHSAAELQLSNPHEPFCLRSLNLSSSQPQHCQKLQKVLW